MTTMPERIELFGRTFSRSMILIGGAVVALALAGLGGGYWYKKNAVTREQRAQKMFAESLEIGRASCRERVSDPV